MSVSLLIATDFILNGLTQLAKASALIQQAREEGRDELTEVEWAGIIEDNNDARGDAQDAVDQAIIEGR